MERVLITGGASPLGGEIAAAMDDCHVRLLDEAWGDTTVSGPRVEAREGSLVDEAAVREAVRDVEVVIHTGDSPLDLPGIGRGREERLLDLATRGTHKLYNAAIEAGVRRFVYGSTLEIFDAYPETVYVSEFHRPLPTTEPASLARYLGEITSREFARDYSVSVTTLRLGRMVYEEDVAGRDRDLMWLDWRDAAATFRAASTLDRSSEMSWCGLTFSGRYALFHVCAPAENPRFVGRAHTLHEPVHGFGWKGERT